MNCLIDQYARVLQITTAEDRIQTDVTNQRYPRVRIGPAQMRNPTYRRTRYVGCSTDEPRSKRKTRRPAYLKHFVSQINAGGSVLQETTFQGPLNISRLPFEDMSAFDVPPTTTGDASPPRDAAMFNVPPPVAGDSSPPRDAALFDVPPS